MLNLNLVNKKKNPQFVRMEGNILLGKKKNLNSKEHMKMIVFMYLFGILVS